MSSPVEQLCPQCTKGEKKYLKRSRSKYMRRLAKRLMDDTPKKNFYKGYAL